MIYADEFERCGERCPEKGLSSGLMCGEVIRGNCKQYSVEDLDGEIQIVELEQNPMIPATDTFRNLLRTPKRMPVMDVPVDLG